MFDRVQWAREWRKKNPDKARAQARRQRDAARGIVDAIKLEAGCVDCGYAEHPEALDFDHVRGEKVEHVAMMVVHHAPMSRILAEIAKCEVRCANCHRVKTALRRIQTETLDV